MKKVSVVFGVLLVWCGVSYAQDNVSTPSFDYIPDATYEEIGDRLSCIEAEIELNYNEKVKAFIDYFTIRDRAYTREILAKKDLYFPTFEAALAKYNLPDELKYLAVVESGLRPNAISRANAVGLWQFISSTGKMYGLHSDWYLDDRMDPFESTDAACRHLRDLYNMFDDWELALAAYNCGPGNVRKAIRRSGYKQKFWEIYNYLPRETRSYVPQFVAIAYTLNYAPEHNLFAERPEILPQYDTILVSQYFHLETFCQQLNLCVDDLLLLNPHIKRGAIPDGQKNFALRIPVDIKDTVMARRTFLYDTASKVGREHLDYLARNTPGSTYGRERTVYRVRSGDVLGKIANQYGVRVADIKSWNNLNSNMIRVGQNLSIWTMPKYSSETKDMYASAKTSGNNAKLELSEGQKIYYVQPGDTLWDIARTYANLSIEEIKKLNNLNTNNIKPGQPLIISAE